jgi:hypothetical protein
LRQEVPAVSNALRQQYRKHYRPEADRVPRWLRRVWLWF